MSKRRTTPSFVLEVPRVITPDDERVLLARLEAGRRLYNAVLGDALQRLAAMRADAAWAAACALPKGTAARTAAFRACREPHGFSENALQACATAHKHAAGFQDRLGAHETQTLASRVWKAVEAYALGRRGRPRFKSARHPLRSIAGKSAGSGLRWNRDSGVLIWGKRDLPAKLPTAAQDASLHAGLQARTKYARLVWRMVGGRRRWCAQLIQEGTPPIKARHRRGEGRVGLDVGPSTVAIVADKAVALQPLAPSVVPPWAEIRRLQRAQDRSRRATHSEHDDAQGRVKPGPKRWVCSGRYPRRAARIADLQRRLAAARQRDHGELANRILAQGATLQTETLSYRAFQRCFGRSVQVRAPGTFIATFTRKAESAGGRVVSLDTRRLCLSQYDHLTGSCTKKPLSQRWHALGGGPVLVQRDAYSAFLARAVEEGAHNPSRLAESWAAAEPLLRRAGLCTEPSASGRPPACPTVLLPSEPIARRRGLANGHGQAPDGPGDPVGFGPRTPRL